MSTMIDIMIVDDHELVRRGLKAYLQTQSDIRVVGEADGGRLAVALAAEARPDVILMDLLMEDGGGVEATQKILHVLPDCKIIILTSYYDDEQVFPALEAGALSYLLKTARGDEIVSVIRKAAAGEPVIEAKVAARLANRLRGSRESRHDELTARELEVLCLLGDGKTNQQIAEELVIGIKTVKTHVSSILTKLELHDRTQAAVYANRHNLVSGDDTI